MRTFFLSAAIVLAMSSSAWAQPAGTYSVVGRNPNASGGPPAYSGTITITRVGDLYDVVWQFGRTRVQGRGLFLNGVFSVTYANRRPAGPALAVYVAGPGGNWAGQWIVPGNASFGTELLTRQP